MSEHPLARAVVAYCGDKAIRKAETEKFASLTGRGLEAVVDGVQMRAGNLRYISSLCNIDEKMKTEAERLSQQGKTVLCFAKEKCFLGMIAVADVIKSDSRSAVERLRKMGIRTVMITGDNELTAKEIARQVGIDEVVSGVLPDGKEKVIRQLRENGAVAMVGDGINDAPALTGADLGAAIGAGTDIAVDAAGVVLVRSELSSVPDMLYVGKRTLRNIHENLFWAFIYNVIGIPLAAGAFIPAFGWELNPMFAAAAMSLSSFCVVVNALRLSRM